jgi:parvulin-like peptidyl-prolyl isomerase
MTQNKATALSIIAGIIVICSSIIIASGVIATKIINERKFASQRNIVSTQVAESFFLEDNPAFLTAIAALPTTTPSSELVEKVHARYILTSDKTTANEVLLKLKSGANWAEMCKQYSLDKVTAQIDCDLGWFPRDVMVKEFETLAFNTPVGEFGGPEQTIYGWVIIQVLGHEIRPYTEGSH